MTIGRRRTLPAVLAVLYAVMWIGGVSSYVLRGGPGAGEAWTAPAFLALAASIVVLTTVRSNRLWLAAILALGFAVEYAGLRCRWIFGAYEYTGALGPRIFGVPMAISAAWMVLVAYTQQVRRVAAWPAWASAGLCAAWMTAIDLVLDPVAGGPLRYWTWLEPGAYHGVPARNFAGWFVVSLLLFALLSRSSWRPNTWARWVGLSIVAFFAIIAASHRLVVPATGGALLCAADLWFGRRVWRGLSTDDRGCVANVEGHPDHACSPSGGV